ncbi:substrate-binding domain-containing protein [Nibricoccus sp. IMCC34717]|uniref:substrate-binding domain-containing protein n=1 Tax=Nibricoccus sp. IMCC34717 TaxID=3034021 RepID=UPI0038500C07
MTDTAVTKVAPTRWKIVVIAHHFLTHSAIDGALKEALQESGIDFRVEIPAYREQINVVLRDAVQRGTDGLILHLSPIHPFEKEVIEELRRKRIPCISLGALPLPISSVRVDESACCEQVLTHFREQGYSRATLLMHEEENLENQAWIHAWREAAARNGWRREQIAVVTAAERDLAPTRILPHLRRCDPDFQGVFCRCDGDGPKLVDALHTSGFDLPSPFGVIGYPDSHQMRSAKVSITGVDILLTQQMQLAVDMMLRLKRNKEQSMRAAPRAAISLAPQLEIRASTERVKAEKTSGIRRPQVTEQSRWSPSVKRRQANVRSINGSTYPRLPSAQADQWEMFDLSPHVNRKLGTHHSWLGEMPLLHFAPGKHLIHGVPFHVCKSREGNAAVVLRSRHTHTSAGSILPDNLRLPVAGKCSRLYFLHACGWSDTQVRFAHYRITLADDSVHTLPLTCQGLSEKKSKQVNIQDWWPAYPILRTENALPYLITGREGDPLTYERYLYTLEWRNPKPDLALTSLEVASNPEVEPTLGLLALTLLKPSRT